MKTEIIKEFYSNGKILCETSYKNKMWHGLQKGYWSSGKLMHKANFKNDIIHGAYIRFEYETFL